MTKDEILIVTPPYAITCKKAKEMHDELMKQKESGVIIIPSGWKVITAPKEVIIGVATEEN